jgi:predicted dienelactone hydrolase
MQTHEAREPDGTLVVTDPDRPSWTQPGSPRPLRIHLWHPVPETAHRPAPMVVLSHGDGASGQDMAWLATPLSRAGYRVAAVDHHGVSSVDGYDVRGFTYIWERPRDLRMVVDVIGQRWPPTWIAAGGFSGGGYAAAALVGAAVDPTLLEAVLEGEAELPDPPEYPGLFAELRRTVDPSEVPTLLARAADTYLDGRVQAAFLICPGAGRLLAPESLRAVRCPVHIVYGDHDTITSPPEILDAYATHVPGALARSLGPVGHDDFIPHATSRGPAVRAQAAEQALQFFDETRGQRGRGPG